MTFDCVKIDQALILEQFPDNSGTYLQTLNFYSETVKVNIH